MTFLRRPSKNISVIFVLNHPKLVKNRLNCCFYYVTNFFNNLLDSFSQFFNKSAIKLHNIFSNEHRPVQFRSKWIGRSIVFISSGYWLRNKEIMRLHKFETSLQLHLLSTLFLYFHYQSFQILLFYNAININKNHGGNHCFILCT